MLGSTVTDSQTSKSALGPIVTSGGHVSGVRGNPRNRGCHYKANSLAFGGHRNKTRTGVVGSLGATGVQQVPQGTGSRVVHKTGTNYPMGARRLAITVITSYGCIGRFKDHGGTHRGVLGSVGLISNVFAGACGVSLDIGSIRLLSGYSGKSSFGLPYGSCPNLSLTLGQFST